MKLIPIHTGYFKLDGGAMFGVVPKQLWQKLNSPDEDNLCNWAMRCLLVDTGERIILIDTGIGDKQDEKFFSHYRLSHIKSLDECLNQQGYKTEDITDVLLTHLHFDHCGGAVERDGDSSLKPAFANAIYWSNKAHWNWAIQPNAREKPSFLKENILPLQESGRLKFIETTNNALASFDDVAEIKIRIAEGHTRCMMLPQITINNRTVVFMADLLPSVAHIPLPYVMAYDMFPLVTLEEKKAFLEEAAANNYILFFEHDAETECCTVTQTDKGIRADKKGTLQELLAY